MCDAIAGSDLMLACFDAAGKQLCAVLRQILIGSMAKLNR